MTRAIARCLHLINPSRHIPATNLQTIRAPADPRLLQSPTENTFSIWQIPPGRPPQERVLTRLAYRNTPQPFSATSAPNVSLVPTTFVPICAPTPTRDPSSAQSVARHLHDSTTERGTRDYTPARRNSSAKVTLQMLVNGAAAEGLHARMLLDVISGPRLVACASNLCSTRRQLRGSVYSKRT